VYVPFAAAGYPVGSAYLLVKSTPLMVNDVRFQELIYDPRHDVTKQTCPAPSFVKGSVMLVHPGTAVGATVTTAVGTEVGAVVTTAVGAAVTTAVGTAVAVPLIVTVAPVPDGVPITKPPASLRFFTARPMLAVPAAVALSVILMSERSALPATPVALNPAVIIWPATVVLFVRLSPDAISAMVPNDMRFDGYVIVNPNAARAADPVFA